MRYQPIPSSLFRRNREKLAGLLLQDSVAVIHSHDRMVRNGDQYYPYRQSSDFFYLTGIEQEMSVLLLCPGHRDKAKAVQLFIRKPDEGLQVWEGPKLTFEEACRISGIESVEWTENLDIRLRELLVENSNVFCITGEQLKFKPEYPSRDERFLAGLKEKYPAHHFRRLSPLIWKLRSVKEPEEIRMIREAIRITAEGFNAVLSQIRPGMKEYEIEAILIHEFIRNGAAGHAYSPIIASGSNACYLHYIQNDATLKEDQMLLMDFGAEYGNYAADCSRALPVSGRFSARHREIYQACLDLFRYARSVIRPGISIEEINKLVWKRSEEEHIRLGLYTRENVKNQEKSAPMYKKYLMHGISHFLGLDVHDAGQAQAKLEEGMVLTCEPGIYIASERTGVRIENNLLVTSSGNTDLMGGIPMDPDAIEEKMNA